MIAAFVLIVHGIAALYAFLRYKKNGISEGFIAVGFVVIIFSVGWTISTMVCKLVFPTEFIARWLSGLPDSVLARQLSKEFTVDTCSLVLLTLGEIVFYYFYLKSGDDSRKQDRNQHGGPVSGA